MIIQIIVGGFLLSVIYVSASNLWLPLANISRSEKWSRHETLRAAAITGIASTASTILFGLLIGWIGYDYYSHHTTIMTIILPLMLIIMGLFYVVVDTRSQAHKHADISSLNNPEASALALAMSIAEETLFSPCVEIDLLYLAAGIKGWQGIITLSFIYLTVTVAGIMILVDTYSRGNKKFRLRVLEHHARALTGILLLLLGVWVYVAL